MKDKFQNKYRIESTRLQNWDYGWNGAYFITICTKYRELFFGNIVNKEMQYSEIGEIAKKYWQEIPDHFSFVVLDVYVVMPNHVHGIVIIDKDDDGQECVPIICNEPIITNLPDKPKNKFGPQSQNMGSIIRGYKTGVKTYSTINQIGFTWQERFHDHIIRNEEEYQRIKNYTIHNPQNWDTDKFNH